MQLRQALDISRGDVAAIIGAGGKTTLLVGLGYELAGIGWRVLATATARIPIEQLDLYPCAMPHDRGARAISDALSEHQFVFLYDRSSRLTDTICGPGDEWTRELLDSVDSDVLLVEADRASGMPFKAPYGSEPWIPPETTLVVPVASLAALGKPLDDAHVYNPTAMVERYGFVENSPVKSPWLAQVLRDDKLGLKHVPAGARVVVYLNRTPERGFLRGRARMIARLSLQSPRIQAVVLGDARGAEPAYEVQRAIGAIVLAAGDKADKMLTSKTGGRPRLTRVTDMLMRSRISHIRVAAGSRSREVRAAVKPLGVKVVTSRAGRSQRANANASPGRDELPAGFPDALLLHGEALAALKAGLRAMPSHVAAVLVALGDQSRMQPRTVYHMLTAYARGAGDLLVPQLDDGIGQPLLVGRRYWRDILALKRSDDLGVAIARYQDQLALVDVRSRALVT